MRIAICVKYVPDSQSDRHFTEDLTVERSSESGILSELDEYAVESAMQIAESMDDDVEVQVITMGPPDAETALRKALQMGADSGLLVTDPALAGSDAFATSLVLQRALARSAPDLVVMGMASTDSGMGVVPALLASRLGWPQVTFADSVTLSGASAGSIVTITRDAETHVETLEASLPAIVSVTDQIGEPRYPSFKGIMAAKKKQIDTVSLSDLELSSEDVGHAGAWTVVESAAARPPRAGGVQVSDDGSGGQQLVAYLADNKLV